MRAVVGVERKMQTSEMSKKGENSKEHSLYFIPFVVDFGFCGERIDAVLKSSMALVG